MIAKMAVSISLIFVTSSHALSLTPSTNIPSLDYRIPIEIFLKKCAQGEIYKDYSVACKAFLGSKFLSPKNTLFLPTNSSLKTLLNLKNYNEIIFFRNAHTVSHLSGQFISYMHRSYSPVNTKLEDYREARLADWFPVYVDYQKPPITSSAATYKYGYGHVKVGEVNALILPYMLQPRYDKPLLVHIGPGIHFIDRPLPFVRASQFPKALSCLPNAYPLEMYLCVRKKVFFDGGSQ